MITVAQFKTMNCYERQGLTQSQIDTLFRQLCLQLRAELERRADNET